MEAGSCYFYRDYDLFNTLISNKAYITGSYFFFVCVYMWDIFLFYFFKTSCVMFHVFQNILYIRDVCSKKWPQNVNGEMLWAIYRRDTARAQRWYVPWKKQKNQKYFRITFRLTKIERKLLFIPNYKLIQVCFGPEEKISASKPTKQILDIFKR